MSRQALIEEEIVDDVSDDVVAAMAELRGEPAAPASGASDDGAVHEQQPQSSSSVPRDNSGRFAKRGGDKSEATTQEVATRGAGAADGADQEEEIPDDQSQPASAVVEGGPPVGWSVRSKAAWDALPPDVRADVVKREGEVAQGLRALTEYKDLKPFAEMATQHGTTIAKALDHFVKMESLCRRDIGAGLAFIAQNSGLNQQQAAQLFAGLAQKFGGSVPATQPGSQPQNGTAAQQGDPLQELLQPLIQPLMQEIGALKGSLTQREQMEQTRQLQTQAQAIQQFATDPANRYFSELESTMTRLLESGIVPRTGNAVADLRAAYDMAAHMNPDVRQALIDQRLATEADVKRKKEQEAANKAKAASRSLSGSRVPGTVIKQGDDAEDGDHDDVEADVMKAIRQLSMA